MAADNATVTVTPPRNNTITKSLKDTDYHRPFTPQESEEESRRYGCSNSSEIHKKRSIRDFFR